MKKKSLLFFYSCVVSLSHKLSISPTSKHIARKTKHTQELEKEQFFLLLVVTKREDHVVRLSSLFADGVPQTSVVLFQQPFARFVHSHKLGVTFKCVRQQGPKQQQRVQSVLFLGLISFHTPTIRTCTHTNHKISHLSATTLATPCE